MSDRHPPSLADLRTDYCQAGLRRSDLASSPIAQFELWMHAAIGAGVLEPTAMTLATADRTGAPSARTVLLKGVDQRGFLFYTNYESRKGQDLAENRHAALCLHWKELERQICIRGTVTETTREESQTYFKSRPLGSQLSAWVSRQTEVVPDRSFLEKRLQEVTENYPFSDVPLPGYWGGYILSPDSVEFWQGRPNRLHDRFRYSLRNDGAWVIDRLSP